MHIKIGCVSNCTHAALTGMVVGPGNNLYIVPNRRHLYEQIAFWLAGASSAQTINAVL